MITDPSWLYSTIAQSSAAIVAIIGGFITASVLMLTSERRNLANQLSEKKIRLEKLKSERDARDVSLNLAEEMKLVDNKDIALLEGEISDLDSRIKAFSYPHNLKMGAYVFGLLAVFGIVLPVLVLAFRADGIFFRIMATVSFCLGIMGVFVYIVDQIGKLRRN